jgi:hypothetical protein
VLFLTILEEHNENYIFPYLGPPLPSGVTHVIF